MGKAASVLLGDAIFADIDSNPYLNELYSDILYNYSMRLFDLKKERKPVDVEDALRFADILSKSTDPRKADKHKIWAQEIVALLMAIEPKHPAIAFYMDTILTNTGNYQGLAMLEQKAASSRDTLPNRPARNLLDSFYVEFSKDFMSIPAAPGYQFFRSQKAVYDRLGEQYLSYSGPTSMGKSFIMRMFIKERILNGAAANFALLVPTKALINEVTSKIIDDLKNLLSERNYRLVTSAGAVALKEQHNFIFVLTPERLLYLLIGNPTVDIDYLFVDEAHKISSKDSRSAFYYKVVDMLVGRGKKPHIIFASPNIPNPEIYLRLLPGIDSVESHRIATAFAPVSQVKYLIDYPGREIQLYNAQSNHFIPIHAIRPQAQASLCKLVAHIGKGLQNIVYCSSTAKAVELALEYATGKPVSADKELLSLSRDIKSEVHGDYFLADVISKGVAYHIGYLPSTIRMRIEELFRKGLIHTMFCTSTLVEGVNLPADNLFITNYRNGRAKMTAVDFKNLIGRVGRIEYNLYGNVFLVRMEEKVKVEKFKELLQQDVPEQKLSIVTELTGPQKKMIVESLIKGNIELLRHPKNQTNEGYTLMRKFALILLRDITNGNNSLVRREFAAYLEGDTENQIRAAFKKQAMEPDDDINVSVDQSNNLTVAIAKGLRYPALDTEGNVSYNSLVGFLEQLCEIFKWEAYESSTLGFVSKDDRHGMLRWYAVILSQWVKGTGLSFIMEQALQYKREHPESGVMERSAATEFKEILVPYRDTKEHRNTVISETLQIIENVILFSISNYFLRFSTEYKRFHKVESFPNDWYEYVEYGTTNKLSIMLQRNGFSRETSTYIRHNRAVYVVETTEGEAKLRRSIAECPSMSVRKEVADILYNIPELFVD